MAEQDKDSVEGLGGAREPERLVRLGPMRLWSQRRLVAPASEDDRQWGMLANLLGIVPLLGPLIVLCAMRHSRYVRFYALQMLYLNLIFLVLVGALLFARWEAPKNSALEKVLKYWVQPALLFGFPCLAIAISLRAFRGVVFRVAGVGRYAYKVVCKPPPAPRLPDLEESAPSRKPEEKEPAEHKEDDRGKEDLAPKRKTEKQEAIEKRD